MEHTSEEDLLRKFMQLNNELINTQRQLAQKNRTLETLNQELALSNQQLEQTNADLVKALSQIRTLKKLLPICSHCKKIRDDHGYWLEVENYIRDQTGTEFTHGLCQECAEKLYPTYFKENPQISDPVKDHSKFSNHK